MLYTIRNEYAKEAHSALDCLCFAAHLHIRFINIRGILTSVSFNVTEFIIIFVQCCVSHLCLFFSSPVFRAAAPVGLMLNAIFVSFVVYVFRRKSALVVFATPNSDSRIRGKMF